MDRRIDNAFTRSRPTRDDRRATAAMHVAMEMFDQHDSHARFDGDVPSRVWALTLSPMRLVDALEAFLSIGAADGAQTLLARARFAPDDRTAPPTLAAWLHDELREASVGPVAQATGSTDPSDAGHGVGAMVIDDGCVVLSDDALRGLIATRRLAGLTLVRVGGPIERADGRAILAALDAGHPAADGDFRATHTLRVDDDRAIVLETDSEELALTVVAENLRQYLAAMLDRDVEGLGSPAAAQIHHLLSINGTITVRPIETDCFETFVDVGIGTNLEDDTPAAHSLVYDLPSHTWHSGA